MNNFVVNEKQKEAMRKKIHIFRKYLWMLNTIYQTGGITRKDLVKRWEKDTEEKIAQRTFAEYRDAIEEIFDININCNASEGYKYYIEDTEDLDKGRVMNWLLTSFSINNMMSESKSLKDRILFEDIPCGNGYLTTIVQAMKENLKLKVVRQSFGQESPYTTLIEPYGMKVFKQRWYLVGVAHGGKKIKTYALDRILQVELTNEHFDMPEDFDMSMFFHDSYGILIQPEDYDVETVHLKVSSKHCHYLRTLPLHHSQKEIEKHEKYSIFTVRVYPTLDFIQEILSHGDEVEVLSPKWVREDAASYARNLYKMYKDAVDDLDERDRLEKK